MSVLVVLLGLALAAYGATASVAALAASRMELTRWVARQLEGHDAAITLLSRPGDVAAAGDALVAIGVAIAGVAAPWALRTTGLATTLALELVVGVPALGVVAYFIPRAVGRRWPEAVVRSVVPRLKGAGALVGRIVRGRAATERAELAALLRDTAAAGLAREDELEIVTGVMSFADRLVREVMTPRTRITAAPEGASTAELARLVTSSGFTRVRSTADRSTRSSGWCTRSTSSRPGRRAACVCAPSRSCPPRAAAPTRSWTCGGRAATWPSCSTSSAARPGW